MVQVDLRVTDSKGRFVDDLERDEVEVLEDGKSQQIDTFFLVRPATSAASAPHSALRPPHIWVFFFDNTNLQPRALRGARAAVAEFLNSDFASGDFGAIVYDGLLLHNRITSSPAELSSILKRVRLPGDDDRENEPGFAVNLLQERSTRNTLEVLADLSSKLALIRGQKSIVLFSDGFPLSRNEGALRRAVDRARDVGVRIYSIDTRGLTGGTPDTLNSLGVDTGGLALFNNNNLHDALQAVLIDASTYYLIGYSPPPSKYDGSVRKISVRVARQRVSVRSRHGYIATPPDQMLQPKR